MRLEYVYVREAGTIYVIGTIIDGWGFCRRVRVRVSGTLKRLPSESGFMGALDEMNRYILL
jgi:hypothetical protein